MRFRPCIDIHNGKVKQLVGGSLRDENDAASENYVSARQARDYAAMFAEDHLTGGHVILLNPASSPWFGETRAQALGALRAAPGSLQIGGGITPDNAWDYLRAGASHVIVTSYVFSGGQIRRDRLGELSAAVGKDRLVLDLSCRLAPEKGCFLIVTDRWQNFSSEPLSPELMEELSGYCDEFLIHAVDAEGLAGGPQKDVLEILAAFAERASTPVTYAGGIHSPEDIDYIRDCGKGRIDFTVGSALDLYGGNLSYRELADRYPASPAR